MDQFRWSIYIISFHPHNTPDKYYFYPVHCAGEDQVTCLSLCSSWVMLPTLYPHTMLYRYAVSKSTLVRSIYSGSPYYPTTFKFLKLGMCVFPTGIPCAHGVPYTHEWLLELKSLARKKEKVPKKKKQVYWFFIWCAGNLQSSHDLLDSSWKISS